MAGPGRHALVSGGGRGIGAAIARALADAGHRVTVLGRDRAALDRVAGAIGGAVAVADLADPAAVAAAFAAMEPVDVLVNNAGIAPSMPFLKTARADFERVMAVNLLGPVETCRTVLPGMQARGWGRIVNVASTAGLKGYAYTAAYVASKHALIGLTRALALEVARSGVTVNAVCPGFADTDIVAASVEKIVAKTGRTVEEARAELAKFNPMGRLIAPEEVAAAVLYLVGERAAGVTGTALPIAGGEVT
jgi:NAD(P)-dependent dehydrogenase (short-subunit alcohol dehydrogenase family)